MKIEDLPCRMLCSLNIGGTAGRPGTALLGPAVRPQPLVGAVGRDQSHRASARVRRLSCRAYPTMSTPCSSSEAMVGAGRGLKALDIGVEEVGNALCAEPMRIVSAGGDRR